MLYFTVWYFPIWWWVFPWKNTELIVVTVFQGGGWELVHREGWILKNWCFWIVVLEKTLESPLAVRRSNQLIFKEINPEYSLEELMLKLKRQYFGHLVRTADSLEKTLMQGKIEGKVRRGRQRMRWLDIITDLMNMNLSKLWLPWWC